MKRQAAVIARAAGLAGIAILHAYWFLQPASMTLKAVTAAFVVLAIARPAHGALAFAAIAPLSTVIASMCGSAGLGAQLIEQIALATGAGTILRSRQDRAATRIGAPALLMSIVAVTSALSMIPATGAASGGNWSIQDLALRSAAQSSVVWSPIFVALVVAECALLGWAVERAVRRTPELAQKIVWFSLAAHAVSATLAIEAVMLAAVRTGDVLAALPQLLMSVRLSAETDWNAAGSLFVLAGMSGAGLMFTGGFRRLPIVLMLILVATGLWITGSRIAIVLVILAVTAAAAWRVVRSSRHKREMAFGVVVLVVALGAWLTVRYPEGRNDRPGNTLRGRLVLMNAGLRMFEEAPVFGIGVDGFYAASARFADRAPGVPDPTPENAHNNFVQVLAEQGGLGLAALLWWLGVVVIGGWRAQRRDPSALRGALLLAVVTCVGTWMTGHPLLVPEFAFVFWLYAGTVTGLTPAPQSNQARWPWIVVVIAGLLVSVPIRASALRTSANLEYRGYGVSIWHHDDTQRYRNAGRTFSLFLPATGRPVELPIRRAPGTTGPLTVTLRLRDQLINRVVIEADDWQSMLVVVPPGPRRYELVDFSVDSAAAPNVEHVLRVGRERAR